MLGVPDSHLTSWFQGICCLGSWRIAFSFVNIRRQFIVSPTLDNFKVLIVMNQEEMEAVISIRKSLALSEEGTGESSVCPLPAEAWWPSPAGGAIDPLTGT